MKLAWFFFICSACALFKLIISFGDDWTLLYLGLFLLFFVLFAFAKAFADDSLHKDDPDWITMPESLVIWGAAKALLKVIR